MFAGHLVESPGWSIWDVTPPDAAFAEVIQGCPWLDDLAALGDPGARSLAQGWVWGWIARYGRGKGEGWQPQLAGRRLIRWMHHSAFLLRGPDQETSDAFRRAMGAHAIYLSRSWMRARPGVERIEALTGLLYAASFLAGMARHAGPAKQGLDRECRGIVHADGAIATRNPEELLEVFALLTWAASALRECGDAPGAAHDAAIRSMAQNLRTLRHSDGRLARFHGGGAGAEGRLDQALAASGVRTRPRSGRAMGFVKMSAGRTSLIIDAAPPPAGQASLDAHASTLAFELTSGRRPLIVSCGDGASFGPDWRRAGRATPSHSALCLDGYSSARLGAPGHVGAAAREMLEDAPTRVPVELATGEEGAIFEGAHDGYVSTHGLTHARTLTLSTDGRTLTGEDMLIAMSAQDRRVFERSIDRRAPTGIPYRIRFHLHPDVAAELDPEGASVELTLASGEVWIFRPGAEAAMRLEASVYLEAGRLRPRACKQVVLSGRAMEYASRVRWTLAKSEETAIAIRDLAAAGVDADETEDAT
ncbi:heparinase II/III family protein [Roseivivax halodurans JCM 10272]|uniref:Heparinase II/III family protein n=2 Tax=Roseivivax halodurans TaxID=93683 RepID=X7ECP3_9RHOB|nr:heparinase II/III family protein [Roseivivax halodurans JCM 10272]